MLLEQALADSDETVRTAAGLKIRQIEDQSNEERRRLAARGSTNAGFAVARVAECVLCPPSRPTKRRRLGPARTPPGLNRRCKRRK
jgi:hypothetical protein